MKVVLVGCPFRTTYGYYYESLSGALKRSGCDMGWTASNCGCTDPHELAREFQTKDLDYFELPNDIGRYSLISYSKEPLRRLLKTPYREASLSYRVAKYANSAKDADVIHLQQTLNAYGSSVTFRMLRKPMTAARIVTIHELDPEQTAHPELNRTYNLADAIIVHDSLMKQRLVSQGVSEDLIHVVRMGTDVAEFEEAGQRDGLVFYGGHHLNKGKGFETLLGALKLLDGQGAPAPTLRVHGHFGPTPPHFLELVKQSGLARNIEWLGDLPNDKIVALYRRAKVCVLPFTASFAGLPVGFASANRLPIVGTRFAGIPDHIGDLSIKVDADDPAKLAAVLKEVLSDDGMRQDVGRRLRAHAERYLTWDAVAGDTMKVYEAARRRVAQRSLSVSPNAGAVAVV